MARPTDPRQGPVPRFSVVIGLGEWRWTVVSSHVGANGRIFWTKVAGFAHDNEALDYLDFLDAEGNTRSVAAEGHK